MEPLIRLCWTVSPELLKAIDIARGELERNAWIEEQLWRIGSVRRSGVERQPRRGRGALPSDVDK